MKRAALLLAGALVSLSLQAQNIGALWVAPNRIQDQKMNCMAHELGHSFQLQIPDSNA